MRMYAAVLLLLAIVSAAPTPARAQGQEPGQYDCVDTPETGEQSVVVAATVLRRLRLAGRYELKRSKRVCTRRSKDGGTERLRSYDVAGTDGPVLIARNRVLLGREAQFIDVDTSTANSIMLPESGQIPEYACYRFLSGDPVARLCVASDLDGSGDPPADTKLLFCNRGRCRPRKIVSDSAIPDLYAGAADASVMLPDGSMVATLVTSQRTAVGELSLAVPLGVRDTMTLGVELRPRRAWHFTGERVTGTEAPVPVGGDGRAARARKKAKLDVAAELTSPEGLITLQFGRKDADRSDAFNACYLLSLRAQSGGETTVSLQVAMATDGIGASRPTVELAGDGAVVTDLAAGDCAITSTGRLWCVVPSADGDLRLFGSVGPDPLSSEFAFGPDGRSGTWTAVAVPCPAS
jgi:hypothetical protein